VKDEISPLRKRIVIEFPDWLLLVERRAKGGANFGVA
jgi:hypothetical protein